MDSSTSPFMTSFQLEDYQLIRQEVRKPLPRIQCSKREEGLLTSPRILIENPYVVFINHNVHNDTQGKH